MKLKKISKNCILAVVAVVSLYIVLQLFGITCPIKFITGISCAGCGMTRAWLSVFRLDFKSAFYYHPLFWMPIVFIVVFLLKKHINEKAYRTILLTLIAVCVIIYLYRLVMGTDDIVVFQPQNNILFRIIRELKNKGVC